MTTLNFEITDSPIVYQNRRWFRPTESEIIAALKCGLVAIDTNVLLNLYKYDEKGTSDWFRALKWIGDRLYIPSQCMTEFWRNRAGLALIPEDTLGAEKAIQDGYGKLRSAYEGWVNARNSKLSKTQTDNLKRIEMNVQEIQKDLTEFRDAHQRRFDVDPLKDEVVRGMAALAPAKGKGARVGDRLSVERLKDLEVQGAERFAKSVPPGYMDDEKNPNAKSGKSGSSKFGDWILWREVLDEARRFKGESDREITYAVLVTGDFKEDWWRRYPSDDDSKKSRIPRPELVEEMHTAASCEYIQLDPGQLLHFLQKAEPTLTLDESTVQSAEALSSESASVEWYDGEFMIKARGTVRARARIRRDGTCRVLSGSTALASSPSMPDVYRRQTDELLAGGMLRETPDDGYEFVESVDFSSPSAAASVIQGGSASGNLMWRHETGDSLREIKDRQEPLADDTEEVNDVEQ